MQWFANLRLRSKLMAAFASVVLMTAVLGIFAISRLSTVNDQSTVMASHWMISQRAAADLSDEVKAVARPLTARPCATRLAALLSIGERSIMKDRRVLRTAALLANGVFI